MEPAIRSKHFVPVARLIGGRCYIDTPIFITQATKVNDYEKTNNRLIVLSIRNFYNVKNGLFGYAVQRQFPLIAIDGVIKNPHSGEFVFKVRSQIPNDYRYRASPEVAESLVEQLTQLRPSITVWTLNSDLGCYTRKKSKARNLQLLDIFNVKPDHPRLYPLEEEPTST